jgi:hypothetical protein
MTSPAESAGTSTRELAGAVVAALVDRSETVAVAESLTGGLLAAALVQIPGASAVFRGGIVAYATDLKATLLGVPRPLLERYGAVHADVAAAMASGVRGGHHRGGRAGSGRRPAGRHGAHRGELAPGRDPARVPVRRGPCRDPRADSRNLAETTKAHAEGCACVTCKLTRNRAAGKRLTDYSVTSTVNTHAYGLADCQ